MLGGSQTLMAIRAPIGSTIIGVAGGVAMTAAATMDRRHRATAIGLVAVGAIPFAVVAWTALVPPLVAVVAVGLALVCWRPADSRAQEST